MSIISKQKKILFCGSVEARLSLAVRKMLDYKTPLVGWYSPGPGNMASCGLPLFHNLKIALQTSGADTFIMASSPNLVKKEVLQLLAANLKLGILLTEKVPQQDMILINYYARQAEARLIGPGSTGLLLVNELKLGIMPDNIFVKGGVGVLTRSATLAFAVINNLSKQGLGQSALVDIGAEAVGCTGLLDILPLFEADPQTKVIVLLGEIGGSEEELAAKYIQQRVRKPVVALIVGESAPSGKRMGHANAIIAGAMGTYQSKYAALVKAGVHVVKSCAEIPEIIKTLI